MACSALRVTPIRSISLKAKGGREGNGGGRDAPPPETAQLIRLFIQMRHGSQSITSLPVLLFKVWVGGHRQGLWEDLPPNLRILASHRFPRAVL